MRLEVKLHGTIAGFITFNEDGYSKFEFTSSYLTRESRPVLGQHFEDNLRGTFSSRGRGLPDFFANIIPEGKLREVIEHTFDLPKGDDFALLQAVSRDLPGALDVDAVSDASAPAGFAEPDDTASTDDSDDNATGLRFSLAGVQMKFSVLTSDRRITLPGRDERGEWIVKLDSPTYPHLVANEFATMRWAKAAGFDVPEIEQVPTEHLAAPIQRHATSGSTALLIKRYDRTADGPVHQEDFNQIVNQPPKDKYKQIRYEDVAILARAIVDQEAYDEVIRRLVFMIATGNSDAHLKNWSLIYPDAIHAELSPLYDQVTVCALADDRLDTDWALKLAGVKKPHATDLDAFRRLASKTGEDPERVAAIATDTLAVIADAWHREEIAELYPADHAETVSALWSSVPLLSDHAGSLAL
jgi:serine/threonine-protein kinase HipA